MDQILRKIQVNSEALKCKNVICENGDHKNYIELLCRQLVEACLQAGDKTLPKLKQAVPQKSIPMWNRVAKEKRDQSLFWHNLWISCGKPKTGHVYNIMKSTRLKYHLEVRTLKRHDKNLRKQIFAEKVLHNNNRKFWTEVKKIDSGSKPLPATMDGKSDPRDICDIFKRKYSDLYSSCLTSEDTMRDINMRIKNSTSGESSLVYCNTKVKDIKYAFSKLKGNKNDGNVEQIPTILSMLQQDLYVYFPCYCNVC